MILGVKNNRLGMIRLGWVIVYLLILAIVSFGLTYALLTRDNKKLPAPFKVDKSSLNSKKKAEYQPIPIGNTQPAAPKALTNNDDSATTEIPASLIEKIQSQSKSDKPKDVISVVSMANSGRIEVERLSDDEFKLTAIESDGYVFTGWNCPHGKDCPVDSISDSLSTTTTVIVPASESSIEVTARFGRRYELRTYNDLFTIKDDPTGYYVLMEDIDASSSTVQRIVINGVDYQGYSSAEEFAPINGFSGCLDGNGKTIFCLTIKKSDTTSTGTGLFGELAGTVKNLTLFDMESDGNDCVGGIAGVATNDAVISGCQVFGNIKGISHVGMIVGKLYGRLENCCACGFVDGGDTAGGLAGSCEMALIANSYASCVVTGVDRIGGLVGYNRARQTPEGMSFVRNIKNCYSLSSVSGNKRVDAIIGSVDSEKLADNSYTENCYFDSEAAGFPAMDANSKGLALPELMSKTTYVNWDFENVWNIVPGRSTPFLRKLFDGRFHIIGEKKGAGVIKTMDAALDDNKVPYFELSALPANDSIFAGWMGWRLATSFNDTTITMNNHRCVVADFARVKEIREKNDLLTVGGNSADRYELMNDLDLTEYKKGTTEPISFKPLPEFKGIFNGNGFAIRGLYIDEPDANGVGLFTANSGEINDLKIIGARVHGREHVGVIAGSNTGIIANCEIGGQALGMGKLGGISGENSGKQLDNKDKTELIITDKGIAKE
ncbi:MAG: hypothetical protein PHX74_03805 [Candidatus Sumerlaeales bacterium]|nr:hypothetical protein [Candidatus Sumerlaeales bacterium]